VLTSELDGDGPELPLPDIEAYTRIEREVRSNSSGTEVHFVYDLLAVLLNQRRDVAAISLGRQPTPVLRDGRYPEARVNLIPNAGAGRVPLILGDWECTGCANGPQIAQKESSDRGKFCRADHVRIAQEA